MVLPIVLFLFMGLVIGTSGVFRYQEVATLAREGARYASTHGGNYQREGIARQTGEPAIASSSDLSTYLKGQTMLLDPSEQPIGVRERLGCGCRLADRLTVI